MAKKYLSIEEAASILGLEPKELNRLREKGEIRAFADRGTWKFRHDEIEELSRSLHADSDPDVPIGDYRNVGRAGKFEVDEDLSSSSEVDFVDENALRLGDSTAVRGTPIEDRSSDSDVRLIADDRPAPAKGSGVVKPAAGDSDSDVRLTTDVDDEEDTGSDSDVKMVDVESQSGIRLVKSPNPDEDAGSDSDVQLSSASPAPPSPSDSNVRLVSSGQESKRKPIQFDERDSDVALFKTPPGKSRAGDSSKKLSKRDLEEVEKAGTLSLDTTPQAEDGSFILGRDDSGISLTGPSDSGIGLHAGDSGIELEDADSGIALEGADSGIALEGGTSSDILSTAKDSGIALEGGMSSDILSAAQDSGIALEGDDSGISLEPDESGITLESGSGDSGIALETGDSGIALDAGSDIALGGDSGPIYNLSGDSGVSLESGASLPASKKPGKPGRGKGKPAADEDDMGGTIPMMNTFQGNEDDLQATQMEVPFQTGEIEDSDFEFAEHSLDDDSETANVINFADEDELEASAAPKKKRPSTEDEADLLEDAVFDVDEGDSEEGSSNYAVEVAEDEELEEMEDVFGAADEDFDEGLQTGESHSDFVAPVPGRVAAAVEADWGNGVLAGLIISAVLLIVTGGISYDLVRSMWNGNEPSAATGVVLSSLRGIFG